MQMSQTAELNRQEAHRQAVIGLSLAVAIILGWLVAHIGLVFFFPLDDPALWWVVPFAVALQCWLYVGMFIVAHDCMHGSLVPYRPQVNRAIGQLCLLLYAGFSFDALNRKHHLHHRHSGTEGDPDYDARPPHGFWRWYVKFFSEYFSGREVIVILAQVLTYQFILGVPLANILVFWTVPALLSSLQLFTFGTYLPHRPKAVAFSDRHNARSNDFPEWLSLLTCFHFGYHHEHHDLPNLPWWKLPQAHRAAQGGGGTSAPACLT